MGRVGEFLGKLFAPPAATGDPLLRAYGKLPFYAEYRRLELAPGTPTQFSQWMDAGRLAWAKSPTKLAGGATRATRALLTLPDSRELVPVAIWDSRDSLGRVFPFAFFVTCASEQLGPDTLTRFVAACELQRSFTRVHAELISLANGGDFYRHFQKRSVSLPSDSSAATRLRERATQLSAAEWLTALGLDDAGEVAWQAALARRRERWLAQPELAEDLALSLPLAGNQPLEPQAALWLMWLEGVIGRLSRGVSLILPAEDSRTPQRLHVIARKLLPDDFQLLTTDDAGFGYVEYLGPPPRDGSFTGAPPRPQTNAAPPADLAAVISAPAGPVTRGGSAIEWLLH